MATKPPTSTWLAISPYYSLTYGFSDEFFGIFWYGNFPGQVAWGCDRHCRLQRPKPRALYLQFSSMAGSGATWERLRSTFYNLVGGWATPLKNMSSSIGIMKFPTYWKIKNGNQTTNQQHVTWHVTWHTFSAAKRCFECFFVGGIWRKTLKKCGICFTGRSGIELDLMGAILSSSKSEIQLIPTNLHKSGSKIVIHPEISGHFEIENPPKKMISPMEHVR